MNFIVFLITGWIRQKAASQHFLMYLLSQSCVLWDLTTWFYLWQYLCPVETNTHRENHTTD